MMNHEQVSSDYQNAVKLKCPSCKKQVEDDIILFSGYPYHKNCVKCMVCHQTYTESCNINDFVDITPGIFLCPQHFNDYSAKKLPENISSEIKKARIKAIVKEHFQTPKEYQNSFIQNDSYDKFLPTISIKLNLPTVSINKIHEIIKDNAVIIGYDQDSLLLKLAFIDFFSNNIGEEAQKSFQNFKSKFSNALGKPIVGNIISEPELTIPSEQQINELLNRPSMNILQNNEALNEVELNELIKLVLKHATKNDHIQYINFFQNYKEDFVNAEKKFRNDIANNQYELVIVAQSIIASEFLNEYQKIKNSINPDDIEEKLLYRGTTLGKHFNIVENGFCVPINKGGNGALFGLGVYATSNLFYACHYGNGNERMKIYQRAPVFLCKTIYNKKEMVKLEVKDKDKYMSKPAPDNVRNNYGVNYVLVGRGDNWNAIEPDSQEVRVLGEEFVFPNSNQIVPICSCIVMRADHYVLWKDENIDNAENHKYYKNVNEKLQVNMYGRKTVEDTLDFIRSKIQNRVKLITNGGKNLSGKRLIEEARKIVGSNFICLVFARNKLHLEWILKLENVLFTTSDDMFEKFTLLKMDKKSVLGFIDELEKLDNVKFNINTNTMLYFPYADFDALTI